MAISCNPDENSDFYMDAKGGHEFEPKLALCFYKKNIYKPAVSIRVVFSYRQKYAKF